MHHDLFFLADLNIKNTNIILYKYGNTQKYSETKIEKAQSELVNYFRQIDETKNIFIEFYAKAVCFLEANFETRKSNTAESNTKKEKKETKIDQEASPEKKCSMKTAEDVINRIFWDKEINRDFITVGYLDRFLGIKEVLFNLFDWGDIVEADINALAIPRHRIHYFKYKNELLWDKKSRLDNVFGSTGSKITIHDIIKKLENTNFNTSQALESSQEEKPNKIGRFKNEQSNGTKNPNYFISIPIKSAVLKESLFSLTCDLIDLNKNVEKHLIPDQSYHITLCTLRADSNEELETIKNVMDVLFTDEKFLANHFPLTLQFEGIGEFYNKVLFAKCNCDEIEKLENVKRTLLKKLESAFVNAAGNYYEFVPHLTIFKINKNGRETNADSVESFVSEYIWNEYECKHFGKQNINEIALCKMGNIFEIRSYPVEHSININH
jgi:2'-5' RNA ligase/uncharacterized protein (UPF0248 family)